MQGLSLAVCFLQKYFLAHIFIKYFSAISASCSRVFCLVPSRNALVQSQQMETQEQCVKSCQSYQ